jgi:FtsH-binding integral membrane protein
MYMGKSPLIALVLSIIPGFGHFYLGLWKRGIVAFFCNSTFFITLIGAAFYPIIAILTAYDAYKKALEMHE